MLGILEVILPVFAIIGFGYFVTWKGWFSNGAVDGLMQFAQNFAVPCLLFFAIACYTSPEYQEAAKIRQANSDSDIVIVEGT